MRRPPLARVAGFALGAAVAMAILAVQLPPGRTAFAVLALLLAIGGVVTAGIALRAVTMPSASDEVRLRRNGLLGRAIVVASRPTGRRRRDREEVETRLDVQMPMRRRFEVTRRDWLTPAECERIAVGRPVMIAADPAEPGHVVLVLDIPDVDERAIAALGPIAGGPGGPRRGGSTAAASDDGPVRALEEAPAPDP